MALSTAADRRADHVKAGYWFSTSELQVSDINSDLFTHLYAGFAKVQYPIQNLNNVIKFPDDSGRFESFSQTVKRRNSRVKALLSIGGEGDDISRAIASVVRDVEKDILRRTFIKRSIQLAREHQYDGLDLCWLNPSTPNQWNQLATFLVEWRRAVEEEARTHSNNTPKLLLTATVPHHPPSINPEFRPDIFQALSASLDWISLHSEVYK